MHPNAVDPGPVAGNPGPTFGGRSLAAVDPEKDLAYSIWCSTEYMPTISAKKHLLLGVGTLSYFKPLMVSSVHDVLVYPIVLSFLHVLSVAV